MEWKKIAFFRQKKEVTLLEFFTYFLHTYINCSVISIMACIVISNPCQFKAPNFQLKHNVISLKLEESLPLLLDIFTWYN